MANNCPGDQSRGGGDCHQSDPPPAAAGPADWVQTAIQRRAVARRWSREKAPINPISANSAERETAGQAPMPCARDAPTSVPMVAGVGFEPTTFGL